MSDLSTDTFMKARDRDGEEDNLHQFNSDSDIRMDENKVTH